MKQVIEKQTAILERVEKNLSNDRVIQLSQAALQLKTDRDLNKDEGETHRKLDSIHGVLKDSLTGDKNKTLNSNVIKLFEEVKKQTKTVAALSKLVPVTPEQSKTILDKSRGNREFKSIGQRFQGVKENVKDLFTTRGFLDKTGIVKRGTGGVFSEHFDAKEAVQKKAQARIDAGDPTVRLHGVEGARKIFEKQETQAQQLRRDQGDDERKVESYKKIGVSEKQIAKSPEVKRLQKTAIELAKVDPALRPEGFDVKTGMIDKTVAEKRIARDTETSSKNPSNKTAKVTALKEDKTKPAIIDTLSTQESTLETQRSIDTQIDLLTKIEENTRASDNSSKPKKEKEEASGGGLLSGILGFLGDGLMSALKFMFNPKNILKFLSKIALPAMIIGSLVNGIMDGFKAFMETGSIGEALIAGLGGVLSFLTFGLFDAETIRDITNAVSGFVDDYIINPVKNFFGFIGDTFQKYIVQPLAEFFAPIANFFKSVKDQIFGFLEDFGIPEIGFTIPIIGKKVSIGPFYPFRPEAGTDKVSSSKELKQSSSADGDKSNLKENIGVTNKNETTVLNSEAKESVDKNGKISNQYSTTMAKFDPKTGKASYTNEDDLNNLKYDAPLTKGGFREIKKASAEGASSDKIKEIIKEDEAYQKLGFFDKMKVDVGYAKATDMLALQKPKNVSVDAPKPVEGTKVYNKSAENVEAANKPTASAPIIVSAPTTNNNTSRQNIAMPAPIRNDDSGFNRYLSKHSAIM